MAEGSHKPTFSQYKVKPICGGCGRKLKATEAALWFAGWPLPRAVYGLCCWTKAAAHG